MSSDPVSRYLFCSPWSTPWSPVNFAPCVQLFNTMNLSLCSPSQEPRRVPPAGGGVPTQGGSWGLWSVVLGWCDVSALPSVSTFLCLPLQVCVPTTSSSPQRVSRCCWSLSSPENCCCPAHCLPPPRTRHLTPCALYRLVKSCLQRTGSWAGSKGQRVGGNLRQTFQINWGSPANTLIDFY